MEIEATPRKITTMEKIRVKFFTPDRPENCLPEEIIALKWAYVAMTDRKV